MHSAIAEQLAASPDDRSLPVHRLMREEGLELFDEWRALPDAVLY